MLDWTTMTDALAGQEPWWEPGRGHGYHVNTFGFLAGEVIRRVTGVTVGEYLRTEVAGPLGADVHIGLPAAEHARVAAFVWPDLPPGLGSGPPMRHNAYFNPVDLSGHGIVNSPRWRSAEIPGTEIVDRAALAEAVTEHAYGQDLVLDRPSRFGLG
jgi:CubicO group peptidase (beta-lactamase class C family)